MAAHRATVIQGKGRGDREKKRRGKEWIMKKGWH